MGYHYSSCHQNTRELFIQNQKVILISSSDSFKTPDLNLNLNLNLDRPIQGQKNPFLFP
ncbi:MAG: hypothetical protein ACOCYO_03200 [Bacteroidota bacterium]